LLDKVDKGSVGGGGYPVVTVADDFNIEAQPNTFYNIKNPSDTSIEIDIKCEELFVEDKSKHVLFSFDELEYLIEEMGEFALMLMLGAPIIKDDSMPGY
jgi:hypothetical protein